MAGREYGETSLPMASVENFADIEFEDKFYFYAHQFGTAGKEFLLGRALTDEELGMPDANEMIDVKTIVPDPQPDDPDKTKVVVIKEKRSALYPDLYKAELNSGLRQKNDHERDKQKMCGKLMMHLDKSLRISVMQHVRYTDAILKSNIILLWRIVKECATGRGAQTANVKISKLLSLHQKSETFADFELYAKEYQEAAIDVKSLGTADEVLTLIFNARFIHGLKKEMFKEQLAIFMSQDPETWPDFPTVINLLARVGRTQRGLDDALNRTRRKDNFDGAINADAARMSRDNNNFNNRRKRAFACFNCGKCPSDHSSKDCPEPLAFCRKCRMKGHLDIYCEAINRRRNNATDNTYPQPQPQNNFRPPQQQPRNNNSNNNYPINNNNNNNRMPLAAGRGQPGRRPQPNNVNARMANVGTGVDDGYQPQPEPSSQSDQSLPDGYYPNNYDNYNYNYENDYNDFDQQNLDEDEFVHNYQTVGISMAKVVCEGDAIEEDADSADNVIQCFKCKTTSTSGDSILNAVFVFDNGCVGDGTIVNDKNLFQYLSKKRNFRINGYDGRNSTSQISGHVDCIGNAVLFEKSPNNLLNVNLFCQLHDLIYVGDANTVTLYTRVGNQKVLTARKNSEGFLAFTYGDLLNARHLLKQHTPPTDEFCVQCNAVLTDFAAGTNLITCCPVGIQPVQPQRRVRFQLPQPVTNTHYSAEQIARAKEAYKLCSLLGHPGDSALLSGLRNGTLQPTHLTEKDLIVARQIFGRCMACTEGKMNAPPPQPSVTPPATRIGEKIFVDLVAISAGCYNSYTFALFAVDEKSAYRSYIPLESKSLQQVQDGFDTLIAEYTLHGHVVSHFVMDDERVFNAMRQPLARKGINATVTPAGLHNKRCERYWQTHLQRDRSVRADLAYELPPYLEYHIAKWVVALSNAMPSKQTGRITPFELFTKQRAVIPHFKFGQAGIFYSPRPDSDQRGEWGIFVGLRDNQPYSYIAYMPMRTGFYSRRKFVPFDTVPKEWNLKPRIRPPDPKEKRLSSRELVQHQTMQQQMLQPQVPTFHATPTSHLPQPLPPAPPLINNDNDVANIIPINMVAHTPPSIIPPPIPQPPPSLPPPPRRVSEGAPISSSPPPPNITPPTPPMAPPVITISSDPSGISLPSSHGGPLPSPGVSSSVIPSMEKRVKDTKKTRPPAAPPPPLPVPPTTTSTLIAPESTSHMVTRNRSKVSNETLLPYDDRAGLKPRAKPKSIRVVRVNRISLAQAEKESEQDPSKKNLTDAAISMELNGLLDTKTLVPIHSSEVTADELRNNCIDGFMFLDDKYLSTGEFEKRKARLVIKGSQQNKDTIGETRAPTVNPITVNTLLAIAATNPDCCIETADVVSAFLSTQYNKSKGKLFLRVRDKKLVERFLNVFPWMKEFLTEEGYLIFEVDTYIYGLAAAAREFNVLLDKVLRSLGFKVSDADPCLYIKKTKSGYHYVCTHVDDMLSIAPNRSEQDAFMNALSVKLKIKRHSGDTLSYIGTTIKRDPKTGNIKITQDHFIQEITKKFDVSVRDIDSDMGNSDGRPPRTLGKPVDSPAGLDLTAPDDEVNDPLLNPKMKQYYQSLIMTLMYPARLTRLDTLFAVTYLATKCSAPRRSHLTKALRVVKHIKGTPNVGICFYHDSSLELKIHADASHLIHPEGFGHTGIVITLGRTVVYARSVKQKMQTLSSTESELLALQEASTYVVWMRYLMQELGYPITGPTVVTQDNQSATTIAEQGGNFQRTKHIVGRFNYLAERIRLKDLVIRYLASQHMPADFLTKPLSGTDLRRHMNAIGMVFN